ncbi:MAG: FHA domain-containing protein [Planctomycetes bacterium]|nr:FHA domain-containing protein [Planctomycetota bacterium]
MELHDGDVITVGGTRIQVAIRFPESDKEDSACGLQYVEPTRFAKPLLVRLEFTDTSWRIENAVALIGRHAEAAIRLDHVDVSTRHALLFRFADGAGIFDLGSRTGIGINGAPCSLAALGPGDRVGIGPCMLAVGGIDAPCVELPSPPSGAGIVPPSAAPEAPVATDPAKSGDGGANDVASEPPALPDRAALSARLVEEGQDPVDALAHIEAELTAMQRNIADSWDRLNRWQQRLRADAQKLNRQDADIHAREAELDAKDAALRGQLHDLTRYHEQITQRERELAAQLARIQAEQDKLTTSSADLVRREGEIARRNDELQRREHVLAQRWARLLAASCPHCGKPVRAANGEPNATRV